MSLAKSLTSILAKSDAERPVCAWLKKHAIVISHGLGGFAGEIIAEFPFASDFRADFVRLHPFSGGWDISFVELEPPGVDLFTTHGDIAERLNRAITQVDNWRSFIVRHRQIVLHDLSRPAKDRELIHGPSDDEPVDNCGWPLYHPKSSLHWDFNIVIGRRGDLTQDQIGKKGAIFNNHGINVMTYDRLIDAAMKLDNAEIPRPEQQRASGRRASAPVPRRALVTRRG
jgi:hypothetical protein